MELKYIKQEGLDQLRANVDNNLNSDLYVSEEPWLNSYLDEIFINETGIDIFDVKLIIPEKQGTDTDLQNCIKIYSAMKDISIQVAIEERMWSYLTHVTFWEYMRKRWPVEVSKDPESLVKRRYMFDKSMGQALMRNGISRLWWIAHSTYDESYNNPYHLTEILLRDSDFQVAILERNFSRNQDLTKNLLKAIDKYSIKNNGFPSREKRRYLIKQLNLIGGTKMLDVLDYNDIETLVFSLLNEN